MLKNFFIMIITKIKNFGKKKHNITRLTTPKKKINKPIRAEKLITSNKKNASSSQIKKTNHRKKMKK